MHPSMAVGGHRVVSGVDHRRLAPFVGFVACIAAMCCVVVSSRQSGAAAWGAAVELLSQSKHGLASAGGNMALSMAIRRAYAKGMLDGEQHVIAERQARLDAIGQQAATQAMAKWEQGKSDVEESSPKYWEAVWSKEGSSMSHKKQALARLESKASGLGGLDFDVSSDEAWKEFAFAKHVSVHSRLSLASGSMLVEEAKAKVGALEKKIAIEKAADEKLRKYYEQVALRDKVNLAETASKLKISSHEGDEKSPAPSAHLQAAKEEAKADPGTSPEPHNLQEYYKMLEKRDHMAKPHLSDAAEPRTLEEYYKMLEKRDQVKKSHLAVTEDPKKAEEYAAMAAQKYFAGGGPEAEFKMYMAAEKGDLKTAAKIWDTVNVRPATAAEGNQYGAAPDYKGQTVNAAEDGAHGR